MKKGGSLKSILGEMNSEKQKATRKTKGGGAVVAVQAAKA